MGPPDKPADTNGTRPIELVLVVLDWWLGQPNGLQLLFGRQDQLNMAQLENHPRASSMAGPRPCEKQNWTVRFQIPRQN